MTDEKLRGIYWFCADYHDGQWSRLYRLSCKIGRKLRRRGIIDPMRLPLGVTGTQTYAALIAKYETDSR